MIAKPSNASVTKPIKPVAPTHLNPPRVVSKQPNLKSISESTFAPPTSGSSNPTEKKKPDNAGSVRKQVAEKVDVTLKMHCLFESSISKDANREITSVVKRVQSLSADYERDGLAHQARVFIDAQADLSRVLMKTLASVCHENDKKGNTAHRKLASLMATLYESEAPQFEFIAKTMISVATEMSEMVTKRSAVGEEAAVAAGKLAGGV